MLKENLKNKLIVVLIVVIAALGFFFSKTTITQKDLTITKLEQSLKIKEESLLQLNLQLKEIQEEKDIVIREKVNADGSSVTTKKISSKKSSKESNIDLVKNDKKEIIKEDKKESLVDKTITISNPAFLDIGLGVSNHSRFNGDILNPDWHLKIKASKGKQDLQFKINDRSFLLEYNLYFFGF